MKWAKQLKNPRAGRKGGSGVTAVQWLSIKETGARRLCSIKNALRMGQIALDAYDQRAAHKVKHPCCNPCMLQQKFKAVPVPLKL